MSFEQLFSTAFGKNLSPYKYQHALAERAWPGALIAPTRLGKTAAVVLGWSWKLTAAEFPPPGRVVYCLPMRTLVEHTGRQLADSLGCQSLTPHEIDLARRGKKQIAPVAGELLAGKKRPCFHNTQQWRIAHSEG